MRVRASLLIVSAAALLTVACLRSKPADAITDKKPQASSSTAQTAGNTACLKCHATFTKEKISQQHAQQGVLCVNCHGPSAAHLADGSSLIKPDILLGRAEVETACKTCHAQPHPDPDKITAWARQRQGQVLPNGRKVTDTTICTDCHGEHVMKKAVAVTTATSTDIRHEPIALFNGRDLAGWVPEGKAVWKVENGILVGTQGPDFAPGDLLTEASYRDFDLTVTYKIVWPANSGVWFRYQGPNKSYQGDILEYANPVAYSGTIYCPGKLFLAANKDKDLVNKDGWNVMRIRAVGDHLQIWLNGILVADAHDSTTDHGRIGFQVHPGKDFGPMKITVRQIVLEPL